MNIELPTKKIKATRTNPRSMVIFSPPKVGKSSALAGLEDCLLIDLEQGSEFLDAVKYDVIKEAREQGKPPILILKLLINEIKKQNKEKGGYVYKRIAIDTVSALEEIVKVLAAKMYRESPMGQNWTGDDVFTISRGAGYGVHRAAFLKVKEELEEICETLILVGHVNDKSVSLNGEDINERHLKLVGQLSGIVCSQVDAVGYLYRKENKTILNFKPSESLIVEGRVKHLSNKEFTIIEADEENNLSINWKEVFKD